MSSANSTFTNQTCANHPDRECVAFCQNCGKPLCSECVRNLGSAVLCEPCLAIRTAAATAYTATPYGAAGVPPVAPVGSGEPNPSLAGFLGLIPGVGAMYNGQYAKGLVHLFVFFILVSLANDVNGSFGIFIAGWIVYQAIEAHHTARARRDGTPLPNPFGLNDLSERMGFGKAWPATPPIPGAPFTPAAGGYSAPYAAPYSAPYAAPFAGNAPVAGAGYVPPSQNWGTPPVPPGYAVPPVPPVAPFEAVAPFDSVDPNLPVARRFPAGAIWLIGLGVLFLVGNSGVFSLFRARYLVPILFIVGGIYNFARKMTSNGGRFENDGTPMYSMRLGRALQSSVLLVLLGVLFLLNNLRVLTWSHSWPILLIVFGIAALFRESLYRSFGGGMPNPPQYPGYPYPPQPPVAAAPVTSTAIVPTHHDTAIQTATTDQEGR